MVRGKMGKSASRMRLKVQGIEVIKKFKYLVSIGETNGDVYAKAAVRVKMRLRQEINIYHINQIEKHTYN